MKKQISAVILLLAIVATMNSCVERINVGNVGLKVNLTGDEKGLSSLEYKTGWASYTPFVSTIVEYSTRYKTVNYQEMPVTAKGGTVFTAHPIITYRVSPNKADKTYMAFGTDDMELIEAGFLHNATTKVAGDVINLYSPDSLLYNREQYENEVQRAIQHQCDSFGIDIQMVRLNLTPPEGLSNAINDKNAAIQNAQTIQNQVAAVKAQAEKDVTKAKGEAAALVAQAQGEAEANRLRQQSLTPLLVQQQFIEKWNGALPVYGQAPQLFRDISK